MPLSSKSVYVLTVILVIGLILSTGVVLDYHNQIFQLQSQNTTLKNQNSELSTTISTQTNQISSLESNVSSLQGQNSYLNNEVSSDRSQISSLNGQLSTDQVTILNDQSQLSSLQSENTNLQNQLANIKIQTNTVYGCGSGSGCTLTIWTVCNDKSACPISSTSYYSETVPDTFDFYADFTSTVPVTAYFLSFTQYTQFYGCGSITCVSGSYQYFPATTSLNGKFTLAEGCGGYIAVFQASESGYLYPDVSITFNPASNSTGVCA